MSLEVAIQENTSALRELIAAIRASVSITAAQAIAITTKASNVAKDLTHKKLCITDEAMQDASPEAKSACFTPVQADNAVLTEQKTESNTPLAANAATYQQAANAVTELARTKGRDTAVAVLKQFNVEKLPEIKVDQYAAVVAACEAAGA